MALAGIDGPIGRGAGDPGVSRKTGRCARPVTTGPAQKVRGTVLAGGPGTLLWPEGMARGNRPEPMVPGSVDGDQ